MCVKNQLLEMLSPLVDIIGYIFLRDLFLFSGCILFHNALKQSLNSINHIDRPYYKKSLLHAKGQPPNPD